MSNVKNTNLKPVDGLGTSIKGHVLIEDDLGNVLLDRLNAVHPQNMARIIARAFANESNFAIHKMAFGNGGTIVDAAFQITYKTPNDGQLPDTAGFASRLYNETYSEVVDDSSPLVDTGLGADPTSSTNVGNSVTSNELGVTSEIVISCTLNPDEPRGQDVTDNLAPVEVTDGEFTFDELGLYTAGLPPQATPGYQNIDVDTKTVDDDTGLAPSTSYTFDIAIDSPDTGLPAYQTININTPVSGSGSGGEILYADLISILNSTLQPAATVSMTDLNTNVNTFGYLRFESNTTGSTSSIIIDDPGAGSYPSNFLFSNLVGFQSIEAFEVGQNAGVQDNPSEPATERERLITHVIFSPITKTANRTLTVTYTLTVAVARSV